MWLTVSNGRFGNPSLTPPNLFDTRTERGNEWPTGHRAAAPPDPEGKLRDGEHRRRVRVQGGAAVSEWTDRCDVTVRLAS